MKIPGLDTLVHRTFWALDRLGRIHTVRDLAAVDLDRIGSILVAVTTALGDSVTLTAALTALRKCFPQARIVGLLQGNFADLYLTDPRLDTVILYHGKYKRWRQTLEALRAERCESYMVYPGCHRLDTLTPIASARAMRACIDFSVEGNALHERRRRAWLKILVATALLPYWAPEYISMGRKEG